jgi:hypothetical protein
MGALKRMGRLGMFTVPDSGKALALKGTIHDRLDHQTLESYGRVLVDILQSEAPDVETLAMAYLLLDNSARFQSHQIERMREFIRVALDARMSNVQIDAQRASSKAAASYARTSKRISWFGIAVAGIATLAALIQLLASLKH